MNNLPVDIQYVQIHKGEHHKPEYLAMNPLGKVPFLKDGDVLLPESAAIMMYLARKHSTPPHWYPPQPLAARARCDSALHWQHSTLRVGAMKLCWHSVLATNMRQTPNPAIAKDGEAMLRLALAAMERYWLAGSAYMAGADDVSIADLLCCCELEQCRVLEAAQGAPKLEELLGSCPRVAAWMARVRGRCGGCYADAHAKLQLAAERMVLLKVQARL